MGCCSANHNENAQNSNEDDEIVAFKRNERKDDAEFDPEEVRGENTQVAAMSSALIVAPSAPPTLNPGVPKVNYAPHYVYGYRGYDSRQNLFFNSAGHLVYHMAALGIILSPVSNTQKFFGGKPVGKGVNQHDDDIVCLAMSKDLKKVATGQLGAKPKMFIWNSENGNYICKYVITEKNTRGIICCAFSPNGQYVAFVDISDNHNVYVMNTDNGKLLWSKQAGKSAIFGICWKNDKEFVTCGQATVKFWNVDTQDSKGGSGFESAVLSSAAYDDKGKCYMAAVNGNIYVFDGVTVSSKIEKAHSKKINAILIKEGKIITAGEDKKIIIRNVEDQKVLTTIDCENIPRAADFMGNNVVVGDLEGGITLYTDGAKVNSWKGHSMGEVWGLDIADKSFITSGDDNKIMLWDYAERKNIAIGRINEKPGTKLKEGASTLSPLPDNQCSRAVAYNPKTKEIAVATNNGEVHIHDIDKLDTVKKNLACAKRWIEIMRYSPNGDTLAVGGHDNAVYIYSVPSYELKTKFTAHASSIIALDWSADSMILRSLDEAFDMIFWNMEKLTRDNNGATNTKDTKWATQSAKIGWHVQGIYPPSVDKTHINSVVKSNDGRFVATGDDWGLVNIYNFPCGKGSKCVSLRYFYISKK